MYKTVEQYKSIEQLKSEGLAFSEILVYSHLRITYSEIKEEIKRNTGDEDIVSIEWKTSTRKIAKRTFLSYQSANNALRKLAKRGLISVLMSNVGVTITMNEGE